MPEVVQVQHATNEVKHQGYARRGAFFYRTSSLTRGPAGPLSLSEPKDGYLGKLEEVAVWIRP